MRKVSFILLLVTLQINAQRILPERDRARVVDEILADRFNNLLPQLMDRTGIDKLQAIMMVFLMVTSGLLVMINLQSDVEGEDIDEDTYFDMLLEMDEPVRLEARKHGLLVDFDADYVRLFKGFIIIDEPAWQGPAKGFVLSFN